MPVVEDPGGPGQRIGDGVEFGAFDPEVSVGASGFERGAVPSDQVDQSELFDADVVELRLTGRCPPSPHVQ